MTSTTTETGSAVSAEKFAGLCNLFHSIGCEEAELTAAHAGDILHYGANMTVCDQSRMLARAVLAYLGLRTGVPEADQIIEDVDHQMRGGEGSITRAEEGEMTMTSDIFDREPDVIYTEKEAVDEGAVRDMDAYGIAWFRGEPVRTVSDGLFRALKDAFGLAATAGMEMTEQDWEDVFAEREVDGQSVPFIADLDGRTMLVPPWATLGELLQVFINDAADIAEPSEPHDWLYKTPEIKAIGGKEIMLQRPSPCQWTAFLREDY